ncbi:MAG: hypothetical protein KatS3mg092_0312 [Patescibacteria group bacterium]|nr:MAG: hypothetical protein KatS3mg092_0312 [Patescibacteria group bacterium]
MTIRKEEEIQSSKEKIRLSVGVGLIIRDEDGNYYLFANKKRSAKDKPNYGIIGGSVKLSSELDEGLTQEGDDFRVSGFSNEEAAIDFFNSQSDLLNPLADLARELGEELGPEELDVLIKKGFQVEGANVSNTAITSLIKSIKKNPGIYFFPLEISGRTNIPSLRFLILYEYKMGEKSANNKEINQFIRDNSISISDFLNSDSDLSPNIFLKITPEEIENILGGKEAVREGENYVIVCGNYRISIAGQIGALDNRLKT